MHFAKFISPQKRAHLRQASCTMKAHLPDTRPILIRNESHQITTCVFDPLTCTAFDGIIRARNVSFEDIIVNRTLSLKNLLPSNRNECSMAVRLSDGSVVTWGNNQTGGDSSSVQHILRDVTDVIPGLHCFAALLRNGRVVTWGDECCGGADSSYVQHLLQDVAEIIPGVSCFAARLRSGGVVTWGRGFCGGDSSSVQHLLQDVAEVIPGASCFAARLRNGDVVTWGYGENGGDSSSVQSQLVDIQSLRCKSLQFHAARSDGRTIIWPDI